MRELLFRCTVKAELHVSSLENWFILTVFLHSQHFLNTFYVWTDYLRHTETYILHTVKRLTVIFSNKHMHVQHPARRHPAWCNLFYGQPNFYIRFSFTFVEIHGYYFKSMLGSLFFFSLQIVTQTAYFLSLKWMTVTSSENTSLGFQEGRKKGRWDLWEMFQKGKVLRGCRRIQQPHKINMWNHESTM